MKKIMELKITCRNCKKESSIQVIPTTKLYPKYCPKCSHEFSFFQKLKNRSMWILIDIRGRIVNHSLIQNHKNNHTFR